VLAGDYVRRGVAEFIGVFALVFIGVGSLIYGDLVGIAFAHGLVIAVMVSSFAMISGGHFNPAVTLGFVVTRRIAIKLAVFYWIVQFSAAALAALLIKWVLPHAAYKGIHGGAPAIDPSITAGKGVAIEAVLTFFFLWVIFASAVDSRGTFKQIAGLAIGLTITLDILMGGGLTGAMMNPARAFGPQLVDGDWKNFWVWYIGPLAGGAIAALVYETLYLNPEQPEPVGPPETGLEEPGPGTAALQ
jgi:MIP family channel proteins